MQAQPSIVWEQTYQGGIYIEEANTIQPTADGGFLLAITNGNNEIVKIDASGNKEWSQVYTGSPWVIEEAADGNFFLGGTSITKIDSNGNVIWEISCWQVIPGRLLDLKKVKTDEKFPIIGL